MINIPTDLIRTFVAVVDSKSFTKAAHLLGVTQPAVSAQIKRLQGLLGADLFDKHGQGVVPTKHGKEVIIYARRLLSLKAFQLRHSKSSWGAVLHSPGAGRSFHFDYRYSCNDL